MLSSRQSLSSWGILRKQEFKSHLNYFSPLCMLSTLRCFLFGLVFSFVFQFVCIWDFLFVFEKMSTLRHKWYQAQPWKSPSLTPSGPPVQPAHFADGGGSRDSSSSQRSSYRTVQLTVCQRRPAACFTSLVACESFMVF